MLDSILLKIAKSSILSRFDNNDTLNESELLKEYPYLNSDGATFVTLNYNGELRGCIGSILAHRRLYDDIVSNARSAAFSDPRFQPLSMDEFSKLTIEVSLLSTPELIEYRDYNDLLSKIEPFKDGLILKYAGYQGTFLPQVWGQLPSTEIFLEHLSMKAGANQTIYSNHPDIYRYRVEAIDKSFDDI